MPSAFLRRNEHGAFLAAQKLIEAMAEPHLIDHYEWQVQGLFQKSMADKMGLNHCGLLQKIQPCPQKGLGSTGR
jgi:hypothetical protein